MHSGGIDVQKPQPSIASSSRHNEKAGFYHTDASVEYPLLQAPSEVRTPSLHPMTPLPSVSTPSRLCLSLSAARSPSGSEA